MPVALSLRDLLFVGITIVLNAAAQIFLRLGMRDVAVADYIARRDVSALVGLALNPYIVGGLSCYVFSVLAWMYVLSRLPVSTAYPMISLVYVVVALAGWLLLNESFSWLRLAGVGVILVGVWLVALSA